MNIYGQLEIEGYFQKLKSKWNCEVLEVNAPITNESDIKVGEPMVEAMKPN